MNAGVESKIKLLLLISNSLLLLNTSEHALQARRNDAIRTNLAQNPKLYTTVKTTEEPQRMPFQMIT